MGTSVLVVEDDLEINELLGEYLALENMRYLKAVTGGAGIHLATAEHPDAVILDLMLPDIDGFEVARQITEHRSTYNIPVIILSCMCQEADKEKGFSSGALFYMNKPFLPDDLLVTVRQALAWRHALPGRSPSGSMWLGGKGESAACARGTHQMVADLFTRTSLSDADVGQMRSAMELLNAWAGRWNNEHAAVPGDTTRRGLKVDYDITDTAIIWRLSEETPGLIAEAFFKSRPKPAAGIGASLMGWGGAPKPQLPAAVPPAWMELLTKTGATRFERDSVTHTIRLVRQLAKGLNHVDGGTREGIVPVIDLAPANAVSASDRTLTMGATSN